MSQIITKPAAKQMASSEPTVKQMLEANKAQIAAALPSHLKPERMLRIALTEINKNPELSACDPISFCGAIVQCAQLGLEPGNALGHVYLIPFWNAKKSKKEVQIIIGYRGLIDLARRSGQIVSISARVVYQNDIFEYEYGLEEKLVHVPARGDTGEILYAYSVAKLKDGGHQFEVMSKSQIDKIAKDGNPVWKNHYDEMARKTLIRRLFKYLPVSIEIASSLDLIDTEETGGSQNNARVLTEHGVSWTAPVTTPQDIGEAVRVESDSAQRLEVLDRVEKAIAEKYKTGDAIIAFEESIGMAMADVAGLPIEGLLAVMKLIRS